MFTVLVAIIIELIGHNQFNERTLCVRIRDLLHQAVLHGAKVRACRANATIGID
jgi:hypothetical protein